MSNVDFAKLTQTVTAVRAPSTVDTRIVPFVVALIQKKQKVDTIRDLLAQSGATLGIPKINKLIKDYDLRKIAKEMEAQGRVAILHIAQDLGIDISINNPNQKISYKPAVAPVTKPAARVPKSETPSTTKSALSDLDLDSIPSITGSRRMDTSGKEEALAAASAVDERRNAMKPGRKTPTRPSMVTAPTAPSQDPDGLLAWHTAYQRFRKLDISAADIRNVLIEEQIIELRGEKNYPHLLVAFAYLPTVEVGTRIIWTDIRVKPDLIEYINNRLSSEATGT